MAVYNLAPLLLRRPPGDLAGSPNGPEGLDLRKALANRGIWLLAFEFACFNLVLIGLGTYYPTFLNEVRGFPLGQAAFIASLSSLVVLVSAPLVGWVSDRTGSRRLFFSLPYLVIAVLFLFPFHAIGWQIPAVMVVLGVVTGAIPTATFAAVPEIMRRPQWVGLGLLAGPVLFSQLVNRLGWAIAGYLMIPVCLAGFLSGWVVKVR